MDNIAQALLLLAGGTYKVGSVTVDYGGTYGSAPSVVFTSSIGSGAAATANMTPTNHPGVVTAVYVNENANAYWSMSSVLPDVALTGGGGAGATAVLDGWQSGQVYWVSGLFEVSSAPASFGITGGGGSGATLSNQNSLPPRRASVSVAIVTNGGSGYTVAPTVVFTLRSGHTEISHPTAVANISGGHVTSITITDGGQYIRPNSITYGYYGYDVSLSGGNGTGATAQTATGFSAITYYAGPDASNGIDGSVGGPNITANGSGYTSAPTFSCSGGTTLNSPAAYIGRRPIMSTTVTSGGANYTSQPSVAISGGTVVWATPSWGTNAVGSWFTDYSVSSITVTAAGSGYQAPPSISFSGGSPSAAATATANMIPE